jgi:hypothetical protein
LQLQFTKNDAKILGSPQTFSRCGDSGLAIADTYPHLQTCADDLPIVRSCYHDSFNHAPAQYMLNTGHNRMGRPCLGSWVAYGLATGIVLGVSLRLRSRDAGRGGDRPDVGVPQELEGQAEDIGEGPGAVPGGGDGEPDQVTGVERVGPDPDPGSFRGAGKGLGSEEMSERPGVAFAELLKHLKTDAILKHGGAPSG